jgi:signal transduction histidine kinase
VTLRQKLLLTLSLIVVGVIAAMAWEISIAVGRAFETESRQQTSALVSDFQRVLQERGRAAAAAVDRLAASDLLQRMAAQLNHNANPTPWRAVAAPIAQAVQLDDLEIVGHDGTILSSAQGTAHAGAKEKAIGAAGKSAFLRKVDLPDGTTRVDWLAVRVVSGSNPPLIVVGGRQLDAELIKDLSVPAGTQVDLYANVADGAELQDLAAAGNTVAGARRAQPAQLYQTLVEKAGTTGRRVETVVDPTRRREDSMDATAIPLKGADGSVLAVLVVAQSQRSLVELQRHIRTSAFAFAAFGILLAIVASRWLVAGVMRPIRQLARAAGQVGAGNGDTRFEMRPGDEFAVLARSLNSMTRQLGEQRERLAQKERVLAWREMARGLARELEIPVSRLQSIAGKMAQARLLPKVQRDAALNESTAAVQAEAGKLQAIVGRSSDFADLPKPLMVSMDARDAVWRLLKVYGPAIEERHIELGTAIASEPLPILGDAELIHRALSHLLLHAMEDLPAGGTLTVAAARATDSVRISLTDSSARFPPRQDDLRLVPLSMARKLGTRLSLAIAHAVIVDHEGTIAVESTEGGGARYMIALPLAK